MLLKYGTKQQRCFYIIVMVAIAFSCRLAASNPSRKSSPSIVTTQPPHQNPRSIVSSPSPPQENTAHNPSTLLSAHLIETKTQLFFGIFIATQVEFTREDWYGTRKNNAKISSDQFLYQLCEGLNLVDNALSKKTTRTFLKSYQPTLLKILYELFSTLHVLYPLFRCSDCCNHRICITEDQSAIIDILQEEYRRQHDQFTSHALPMSETLNLLLNLNKKLLLNLLTRGSFVPYPLPPDGWQEQLQKPVFVHTLKRHNNLIWTKSIEDYKVTRWYKILCRISLLDQWVNNDFIHIQIDCFREIWRRLTSLQEPLKQGESLYRSIMQDYVFKHTDLPHEMFKSILFRL